MSHEHFYYDAESITHPWKDIIRVWCKQVYMEKGVIDRVGYWMDLCEFHCADRKVRPLSSVAVSTDETTLHSFDHQEPEWRFISKESMLLDILYNILCI